LADFVEATLEGAVGIQPRQLVEGMAVEGLV